MDLPVKTSVEGGLRQISVLAGAVMVKELGIFASMRIPGVVERWCDSCVTTCGNR